MNKQAPGSTQVRRLDSIDLVRGAVMALIVLDHVKGNFSNARFDSVNLLQTTPAYFVTRWITHFCAPTFILLAGTGAFLYGAKGRSTRQLSWFLVSRGIWLIVLELTVIRYSWFLDVDYHSSVGQVIWVIGWSMIVLAGLVFLPLGAIAVFGVSLIAFHNLADGVLTSDWGRLDWLWKILHTGEAIEWAPKYMFYPFYPLIPWVGVMAAGYGVGALLLLEPSRRRRELFGLGAALVLTFLALRAGNTYGDKLSRRLGGPGPWMVHEDWWTTIFAFVNCQKYPPSLDFLLMTLGPALIALSVCDRDWGRAGKFLIVFGRVPLFFYILHFYFIKILVLADGFARARWANGHAPGLESAASNQGFDLWVVYLLWIGIILSLYPLCAWFARVKSQSRSQWLSYL